MKKNRIYIASLTFAVLFIFLTFLSASAQKSKVACVGNSITYGYGLDDPSTQSYPAPMQKMLGADNETRIISNELDIEILPTAQQIASKMKVGWNMGNTLEAIGGETAWGGAYTTQKLIDSVKTAGFNTVRLPVAWFTHSDTITSEINPDWIERVKEVVDYCINDSLFVIINMHWDNGWLENRVNTANQETVNKRLHAYWTQIANYFKDYDEHLLFAGANEPNVEDAAGMDVLLTYHQTFIDAVRATGGNNSSRTLIVQGPSTDIEKTNKLMNTMPTDQIEDRLMVEIHYYTPYQFCLMSADASWGKMFYYWGKDYHSATDVIRNATWGEESDVEKYFGLMKTKFVDKGIPVILGEFGAYKRKLSPPSDQALHDASVEYYINYVVHSAVGKGLIPYYWDTNMGLFNRKTGVIINQGVVNAIMQGAGVIDTIRYTLNSSVTGRGSIRLSREGDIYNDGTVLTITAVPDSGYQFVGWGGDLSGSTNPVTLIMKADYSITANFTENPTGLNVLNNTNNIYLYPNPFTSTLNIKVNCPDEIEGVQILDIMGKQVEAIAHSNISNLMSMGISLKPGIYLINVYGKDLTMLSKVIKM